jgi:23S rRNA (pseudouridine1915-N3)-methyltransferase
VALALGVVAHAPSIAAAVRLIVLCVGKIRQPFVDDVAHYERLLARHVRIETIELPESDPEREGGAILKRIPKDAHVCVLDREGRPVSSEALAGFLEERRRAGRDVCFVIGGPFGLSEAVLERAQERISLGAITLPHQLARVVLLEQVFRAHKIVLGQQYHY